MQNDGRITAYVFNNCQKVGLRLSNLFQANGQSSNYIWQKISAIADSGGSINLIGFTDLNQRLKQTYNITAIRRFQILDVKMDIVSKCILLSYIFNNFNTKLLQSVNYLRM